jgi:hypothetical protein
MDDERLRAIFSELREIRKLLFWGVALLVLIWVAIIAIAGNAGLIPILN